MESTGCEQGSVSRYLPECAFDLKENALTVLPVKQ
jgi:hypothetical protein